MDSALSQSRFDASLHRSAPLASPVPGGGRLHRPPAPVATPEVWDGYAPECTLGDPEACRKVPLQTVNLKGDDGLYRGIEVGGNEWMALACDVARDSLARGGGPFGAVLLQIDDVSNEVIRYWTHHNHVVSAADPTAHAEVLAVRSACASLGVFHLDAVGREESLLPQPGPLSHAVIYSSAEPCPMCYAAIRWAHLRALYFAATRFDASAPGVDFSDEEIYEDLVTPYSARRLVVRQCTTANSLGAFNLWKRTPHARY